MKRFFIFSILIVIFGISAHAQLLWKITGTNLKKPSYLFVTHNLIPIQFLDSIPEVFRAYSHCDIVVSEVALNNIEDMTKIQQAALLPDNTTLADLLNIDEFVTVDNELRLVLEKGLNTFARLHPALVRTFYQTELFKKTTAFAEDTQSDSYFQLTATQQGKQVVGLETAEQQISFLFPQNNTLKHEADLLVNAVVNKEKELASMLSEIKYYKTGNIDLLSNTLKQKEQERYPSIEEYEQQLKQRNIQQFAQLLELINASPCFITVSAIHLQGQFGLINLLREKKYNVKEVIPIK